MGAIIHTSGRFVKYFFKIFQKFLMIPMCLFQKLIGDRLQSELYNIYVSIRIPRSAVRLKRHRKEVSVVRLLIRRFNRMHRPAARLLRLCLFLILLASVFLLFSAMFSEGLRREELRLFLPEAGEYIAASITLSLGGGFLFDYICACAYQRKN